jgi:hypothetical protein
MSTLGVADHFQFSGMCVLEENTQRPILLKADFYVSYRWPSKTICTYCRYYFYWLVFQSIEWFGWLRPFCRPQRISRHAFKAGANPKTTSLPSTVQRPILNFALRGKLWPLGTKLSHRGEICPLGVKLSPGGKLLCSPHHSSTEEIWGMGGEIESRKGIHWVVALKTGGVWRCSEDYPISQNHFSFLLCSVKYLSRQRRLNQKFVLTFIFI